MNRHEFKRKKSIFRKTAVIFVIVAMVPITILGLRGYHTYSEELGKLVNSGSISQARKDALLHDTEVQSLTYAGYGLVIALVLGYFFAASVVRPIRTLQDGASRIGEGDLDFRVATDTEDELEELATTINNMAVSLQEREAEIKNRSRDLEALYEIAHSMTESLDPNELLNNALDRAVRITGSLLGCLLLAAEDGSMNPIICRASGRDFGGKDTRVFEFAAGMATGSGEPVVFDYPGRDFGFDSVACVPLKCEGRLEGALCLAVVREEFSQQALQLLTAIGSEVAVAIENASLFKKMERQNLELAQATSEIASLIAQAESQGSFGIRYQNRNLINCWEHRNCRQDHCPAYGSENLRCWQLAGTHCGGEIQGVFAQKIGRCEDCEVFRLACPDKITMLGETFNNMMVVLEQRVQEQEELQQRLFSSAKLAAIGELAAGVAHEINNPLTGILGNAALLKNGPVTAEKLGKRLAVIESEALRARDIVRNLLDFAHQGSYGRKASPVSVNSLVEHTMFLVRHQADLSDIRVRTLFDDSLPSIMVDANQIKQVFMNIMHNAVQAMPGGGELDIATLLLKSRDGLKQIAVRFSDTGPGIEKEEMARIFNPFYTTKRAGEGTGLGLSVSQRIISEHGGEIKVSSTPGCGSTFTVVLPVNVCALGEQEVA